MADSRGAEPLTSAERAALEFLARVYDVAEGKGALKHLPAWMHKYRAPSKTLHGVGREPEVFPADEATTNDVTVAQRRSVLRIVAAQSGHEKEAYASTSTEGALQLVRLYERAHEDGVRVIERLAKSWMLETLRQHARDQSQLLMRANTQRISLQWAAKFVHARVFNQLANRRGDLDRVLYPKNRRSRDGDLEQRILRVRYILAVRAVLTDASTTSHDVPPQMSRRQASRGLSPTPLNRQTDRADGFAVVPNDASLLAALQYLTRIRWHPRFGAIVEAWQADWSNGFRELAEAIGEALRANADLAKRLTDEPSRVWAFGAAIQQALGNPTLPGTRGLVKYAFVYAGSVKTPLEEALETIGAITTLLAAFGGPAAPAGVVADAVVQSASAAMAFLRQMDQDDAEAATLFDRDADRLSEGGRYFAPVVQAVGALAAAVAVPHALQDILSAERSAARLPLRSGGPTITLPSSAEVSQARKELAEQLELLAKEAGFEKPRYEALQMTPPQTDVFMGVNGRMLSSPKRPLPTGLGAARTQQLATAQDRAQSLLDRLAEHWSEARPGLGKQKETAEQAAKRVLDELTSSPPSTGTVNQAVRDALYDGWRTRFTNRVKNDPALIADLRDWAGVEFTPPGSKVTAFRVQAVDRNGAVEWVDLNWDHAFRHDDAVAKAIHTGDSSFLVPTVDPKNLGANLARENQVFKEGLIRHEQSLLKGELPPRAPAGSTGTAYETLGDL